METRAATSFQVHGLLVINLLLQAFDGIATYMGFAVWGEGNPLLRAAIAQLGLGLALVLAKASGCVLLFLIWCLGASRFAVVAMSVCALALCGLSVVPWLDCFWAELTV